MRQIAQNASGLIGTLSPLTMVKHSLFETRLELVDLVLGVAKLLQYSVQLALVLWALLWTRDSLVKRRRTADEYLDVLLAWVWKNFLQHLFRDKALAILPVLGWCVKRIEYLEPLGVIFL